MLSTFVAPVAASSHTRWVDNNTSSQGPAACANAHFSTIQAAINASNPGDKVYVCPGNYQEEVTIDVNNLEVRSIPALGANIWAPATMTDLGEGTTALVNITGNNDELVGFWLKFNDGTALAGVKPALTTDCVETTAAIWAQGNHETIKSNHIKTVGDNTLSGQCGYLFGIVAADMSLSSGGSWGPDTSLLWRNWIIDFKEGGILTGGDRSVKVWNNNIRYVHYNDPATCNFIPVEGINPSVAGNPGDTFPCEVPPPLQGVSSFNGLIPYSVGILDEGALVDLRANTVYSTLDTATVGNQYSFLYGGIFLADATDGSRVRSNIVDNVWAGMSISDSGFILPLKPSVPPAPDGVAVSGNRISEGFFSLMVDASDGYYYANRVHLNFVGTVVSSSSANNVFDRNDFRYNVEIDCADDSTGTMTANTANDWGDPLTNLGFYDDPDGICVPYFQVAIP